MAVPLASLSVNFGSNDYYEYNYNGRDLAGIRIYMYDLFITTPGRFDLNLSSKYKSLSIGKVIISTPNGRVLVTKRKPNFTFDTKFIGKHLIKMWICSDCVDSSIIYLSRLVLTPLEQSTELSDVYFTLKISHSENIDLNSSKIKLYNLLGTHKEGALHKGEFKRRDRMGRVHI